METITRDVLWRRLQQGDPITIVETLPEPFYRKAHLPGAINIPPDRIDELAPAVLPDREAEIVVYCADLSCGKSLTAARRLAELGYERVYDYTGGKQDWITAGLPVEERDDTRIPSLAATDASPVTVVACSLDEGDLAERSAAVRRELFAGALDQQEIEGGYAFRFPGDIEWEARIEEFVATERRCCSFFQIDLTYEPALGPIWLRLTGPEGTTPFIEETFSVADALPH